MLSRFLALVCGGALLVGAAHAQPAKPAAKKTAPVAPKIAAPALALAGWSYQMADEPLEANWSWRAQISASKTGEARAVFGWKDARNFALLRVTPAQIGLWNIVNGVPRSVGQTANAGGTLTLQISGARVRVLSNDAIAIESKLALSGAQFGAATQGGFGWDAGDVQPTGEVLFRDDFMRAQGPDDAEVPSEWQVEGNWKTSGALGPKSDAALNPNPFVFRASYPAKPVKAGENVARAGRWFWSDYALTASVRAVQNGADKTEPLTATLEAMGGIGGEIDFQNNVARLTQNGKTLAQSAPFDTQVGQWHRVRLEPGPGMARLLVDGIERVRFAAKNAQGAIALRSRVGRASYVDFDDVRVAPVADKKGWGEGSLPDRFQKDRLMKNWASAGAAWKRDAAGTWWHTGDFFGETTVSLPLPPLEDGQGVRIVLGAKEGEPQTARARVEVERKGANLSFATIFPGKGSPSKPPQTVPLTEAKDATLTINYDPGDGESLAGTAGRVTRIGFLRLALNERVLGAPMPIPQAKNGAKIGIMPLKNGAPLAATNAQKIVLTSATFERGGQAVIGVNITPVTPEIARANGLPAPAGAIVDFIEANSPALKAGVQIGDVVVGVNDKVVTDVDSMRAAVGEVKPGANVRVEVLRATREPSAIDWENVTASTPDVLDYSFTTAPVDWRAARGRWQVAERWTCSPQWSFFSGQNSDAPLLWSRFQTRGDWTLEAYLATPMDLSRGERSPSDLNVTVGGDGRDIASGYSFGFAADRRANNTLWRGDQVALQKPFEAIPGAGDTHQDWFYIRIEKRAVGTGVRFKWSVNGREIATYTDPNPLSDGGHLAFWSVNGGLSMARVRLWNSGLVAPTPAPFSPAPALREISNPLGTWSVRGAGDEVSARFQTVAAPPTATPPTAALQIINPQSGGDWTTYVTRQPFAPALHPTLSWDYKMGADVKLNLYAKIGKEWREIIWSGGASDANPKPLGALEALSDGQWHHASFDLLAALRAAGLNNQTVEALAFAAPDKGYLRAGIGGNHAGANWELRAFDAPTLMAKN